VGEDVRYPTKPRERERSLGRFKDRWSKNTRKEEISWDNEYFWVWVGAPWAHDVLGMCYILCRCVCVWACHIRQLRLTIPRSSESCVMCARHFPRGVPGGPGMAPPGYVQRPKFFFLAFFSIFSGFLN
jgi:hypothetical protein